MQSSAFGEWLDSLEAEKHVTAAVEMEMDLNPDDFITAVAESIGDDGQVTAKGAIGSIAKRVVAALKQKHDGLYPNAENERYDRLHAAR